MLLEGGLCGAACIAEVFIGILATRMGRIFLLMTKILGLILDGIIVFNEMKDGMQSWYLLILIGWERLLLLPCMFELIASKCMVPSRLCRIKSSCI